MVDEKLRLPPKKYGAPGVVVVVLDCPTACLAHSGALPDVELTCPYVHIASLPGVEQSPAKTVRVSSSAIEAVKAEVRDWPRNGTPAVNVCGLSEDVSSLDDVLRNNRSTEVSVGENMYSPRLVWFSHAHESERGRIVVGTYGRVWPDAVAVQKTRAVQRIVDIDAIIEDIQWWSRRGMWRSLTGE
jgi:hypothetical protein